MDIEQRMMDRMWGGATLIRRKIKKTNLCGSRWALGRSANVASAGDDMDVENLVPERVRFDRGRAPVRVRVPRPVSHHCCAIALPCAVVIGRCEQIEESHDSM